MINWQAQIGCVLIAILSACGATAADGPKFARCTGCTHELNGLCVIASSKTICRDSAGPCDPPEYCDGVRDECPADARSLMGTICRPSAGACDFAEQCDGVTAACPQDLHRADNSACSKGLCWLDGLCGGGVCTSPSPKGREQCGDRGAPGSQDYECTGDSFCDGLGACRPELAIVGTHCWQGYGAPAYCSYCDAAGHCAGMTYGTVRTGPPFCP